MHFSSLHIALFKPSSSLLSPFSQHPHLCVSLKAPDSSPGRVSEMRAVLIALAKHPHEVDYLSEHPRNAYCLVAVRLCLSP